MREQYQKIADQFKLIIDHFNQIIAYCHLENGKKAVIFRHSKKVLFE